MTLGIDVSRLFSEMVMASQTHDLVQKGAIWSQRRFLVVHSTLEGQASLERLR